MSKLLFRLRGVPEDEAHDVRELLTRNGIDFFETSAGNWGISMPALWVIDPRDFDQARQLINQYQADRSLRVRQEYELSRARGEAHTLWRNFKSQPIRFLASLGLAILVLVLSLRFFLNF